MARLDVVKGRLSGCLLLLMVACKSESQSSPSTGPEVAAPVPATRDMGPDRREPREDPKDMGLPPPDAGVPDPDLGPPPPDLGPPPPAAARPLQFKKFDQLREELARILELEAESVCRELGRYSCTDEAHRVVLGGAKAIEGNIYWGDPSPGPTTPIAFERVVLAACRRRAELEVASVRESRAFFEVVEVEHGTLDPEDPKVTSAMQQLYRRGLLRDPTPAEVEAMEALYADIEAVNQLDPAMTWFQAVCAGVLSSTEFAFY